MTRFDLPPVCLATGATEGVSYHKSRFSFVPIWARLSVAFCGLIGVILMVVNTKRVEMELPFTEEAFAKWKRVRMVPVFLILGGLVPLFGGLLVDLDFMAVGLVLFLAMVIAAVVHALTVVQPAGPVCRLIDDDVILLEVPSAEAAAAIEQRLGLGEDGAVPALAAAPAGDVYDERLRAELDRM